MKASRYNFFFPFEEKKDTYIAYNALTNSLALIDDKHYKKLKNFLEYGEEIEDENFISALKQGLYVMDDEYDELNILKSNMLRARYSSKAMAITIAPTLSCNFGCIYCYEKESRSQESMTEEVQNKIIKIVEKNTKYIEKLQISWYGGEPLLEMDIIENLSYGFIEICREKDIQYEATIVTNGYKLTKDVALKLKELKITNAQVTLDGTTEIHNKRRPLIGGQPTFMQILKNIKAVKDIIDISIRVNVDRENVGECRNLLAILKEFGLNNVNVYLGYVEPTNNCYSQNTCMEYVDFSQENFNFQDYLHKEGFLSEENWIDRYPNIVRNYCLADSSSGLVISPNGDMYKCWSDIGIEKYSVGNILDYDKSKKYYPRLMEYLIYDPTSDQKCKECSYLPLCMGGCPRRRLENLDGRCVEYKYNMDKYISKFAVTMYNKNRQAKIAHAE